MTKTKKKVDLFALFYQNSLVLEAIVIFGLFQIFTGGMFLTVRNLSNLLMQGATCSIIAITMCLVIITGNADLSAGRYLGMLAMVAALIQVNYGSVPSIVVVLIVFAIAIITGLWHGFWVGYMKLPAFIITLATQLVFLGINQYISDGRMVGPVKGIIAEMGNGYMPSISGTHNDTTLILGALIIIAYIAFTVAKEKKSIKQGLSEKNWMKLVPKMALIAILAAAVTVILYSYKGLCLCDDHPVCADDHRFVRQQQHQVRPVRLRDRRQQGRGGPLRHQRLQGALKALCPPCGRGCDGGPRIRGAFERGDHRGRQWV